MKANLSRTRFAAFAMLMVLLFTCCFGPVTAQATAPNAGLIAGKPAFTAGGPATFKGRGFASGERVTLTVTHVRGTGASHTLASVLADPSGGFDATWLVCSDDCVGELLQIEATGQTSGKVGRAVFMDLSAPPPAGASAQGRRPDRAAAIPTALAVGTPTFELLHTYGSMDKAGLYPRGGMIQGTDGALYGTTTQGGTLTYGTLFKMNPDGSGFALLVNFDYSTTGGYPQSSLIQGSDGALYGTNAFGGSGGYGTVFKVNTDGTGFTVLRSFDSSSGRYPYARLVQGTDGALYGTAYYAGGFGYGSAFKLNTDGTGFAFLRHFDASTGGYPIGGMIQGTDGALYGTTYFGGSGGSGTVFKMNTDGTGHTVLKNLDYSSSGGYPYSGVVQGTDGALYGTTFAGGAFGAGVVYRLNTDGTGFSILQNFDGSTGAYPYAGLVQGTDGALYGASTQGGSSFVGTAFKLNTDGTGFAVLRTFSGADGYSPYAPLMQAANGALYGTATSGGSGYGTAFTLNTDGTGFSVLKTFSDGAEGGLYPYWAPIQATDGKLYGVTYQGGSLGYGTVFTSNADGSGYTILHNFDYTTSGYPIGLIQGTDGALYGTGFQGGTNSAGTVFKLNTDGTGFTVLANLEYSTTGAYPNAPPIQGTDGALYCTAYYGGSNGYGTVFKVNPDGTGFAVLQNFDNTTTGGYVFGWLVQGTDSALYGTTYFGGSSSYGTVFKLNTDGTGFTVLRNFDYSTGGYLYAGLIQGADGALYGTTSQGGGIGGGTLFKLNTDGTGFAVLHDFDYATGNYVYAGLAQGADGALYGTAVQGGAHGFGTVFGLETDGSGFTVLHEFDNGANGSSPYATLLRGTDGNLYGANTYGGHSSFGTQFRLVFAPANQPPVARCKDVTVFSGAGCAASASVDDGSSDPDAGDTITLAQSPPGPYPIGSTPVTLTVTDNHGASSECSATVTVTNPAPVAAITGPASGSIYAVNTPVAFTGSWTDANGGAHTAQWTFDVTADAAFPAGTGSSGAANTSHTFTAAGVYMVRLTVADDCDSAGTTSQTGGVDAMVVVFDPSAGFVTGGGWINSPAGAYTADPSLTGKANFGFVSKYKKGATIPTGETEFQYKVGNLNFHSTSYDWLVVSGARAQYKGSGTINGAGDFAFMLTSIDGQITGGGGQDKFRMKITNKPDGGLVYDNMLDAPDSDDPTTLLGGGSIVIHKGGNSSSALAGESRDEGGLSASLPVEFALEQNLPNPFDRSTEIAFSLPERSRVSLVVYDLAGRTVRTLADAEWGPGRHHATMSRTSADGGTLGAGVYFVRINARALASGRSFTSMRKMIVVR